jgi:hypothetical protein
MSATTLTTPLQASAKPVRRKFTIIPRLDEDPKIVAQAQTVKGKLAVLLMAASLLTLVGSRQPVFLVAAALVTFAPDYRRIVLAAAGLYWIVASGLLNQNLMGSIAGATGFHMAQPAIWILSGLACLGLALGMFGLAVRKQDNSILARRPVLCLGVFFCLALGIAGTAAVPAGVRMACWVLVAPLSGCFWLLAYTLRDWRRNPANAGWTGGSMLATLWMGASSSSTPMLKGPAHARQVEARDARQFAVTQLKAVKLLAWTVALRVVTAGIQYLMLRAGVPSLEDAIDRNSAGALPAVWLCWASLACSFVLLALTLTMWGHTIVAGCRLLGFKALRNTYAPFRARTIAEFWNRIYFYFKELLVDHFYYPAYLRYFKGSPRLRTAFATFAAAGFGNAFYHFARDVDEVARLGLWRALVGFQVYLFYAMALATGISISQWRGKRRHASWFRTEVVSRVTVVLFYCLIHVFDDTRRTVSLGAHFAFLFRLAGL